VNVSDGITSSQTDFVLTVSRVLILDSGSYKYSNDTFATNCKEYIDSVAYSAEGDGTYWVDPDGVGINVAFPVFCDMTTASGGWTRVFYHDISSGTFANKNQAKNFNPTIPEDPNKYSILSLMSSLKSGINYELYMSWPSMDSCNPSHSHWSQTSNPFTTYESVTGFVRTSGNSGTSANGLCLSSRADTLLDGNCGPGTWWNAVGQVSLHVGGIPACGTIETQVELLIR
jgi:hypothetical protein